MKRISRFLAILAALMMLCTSALADLQVYCPMVEVTNEGLVRAVVYASKDGSLTPEDMTVRMDASETVPVVTSFERSDMGMSWILVVDISTVSARSAQVKALLTGLISNLGEFDNAAIYTTAMAQTDIQLTQDKTALNARIEELPTKNNSQYKMINSKVSEAMAYLDSSEEARERHGIVVISDGENADTSVTKEELIGKAAKSETIIYTVALKDNDKADNEDVNSFGAIARSSKGGVSISIPKKNKDMSTAISQITSNEKRFRLIEADPLGLSEAPSEMSITIRDAGFEQDVTVTFNAVQREAMKNRILGIQPVVTDEAGEEGTEPTATPTATVEGGGGGDDGKSFFDDPKNLLIVLGGVLAVLVIVLVVVVVTKKNKPVMDIISDSEDASVTQPVEGQTEAFMGAAAGVTVVLDGVSNGQSQRYTAQFTDSIVVGRVASKSRIVIPDEKVSGAHMRLIYAGGSMYIEDLMSRNGTKVNGSPITNRTLLQRQDVITIGATNLRINWQ